MSSFQFKQFSVEQDRCAMKIGTDGVLLAAWASLDHNPFSILDIGAGTGVIALMLAQRSSAELIDALEIDEDAYEQCVENFEQSDWGDRLFCYHASLEEYTEELTEDPANEDLYDLIISNPPFYEEDYNSPEENRNTARFTKALPFNKLIISASKLLSPAGRFQVIIPYKSQKHFIQLAQQQQLHLQKITTVQGRKEVATKRCLLQFGFQQKEVKKSHLIIEKERHVYTEDYKELVKDFYLNM